jgi:spore germination protein GerM
VATRKTGKDKNSRGSQAAVIFWLVFIIVIVSVFFMNKETIYNNIDLFKRRLSGEQIEQPPFIEDHQVINIEPEEQTVPVVIIPQDTPQVQDTPVQVPQSDPVQTQQPVVQTRSRNIFFTQIDRDGQILRSGVTRQIPLSDSPMTDVLNVMLAGPSLDEINRGIISLIPANTRLLSAIIRGTTAYLSFSDEFQFNTFGVEGYAAQLRQIIWTVTEFPTVNDVQILIEGRRVDYLGEGIYIGSPVDRQSF